MKVAIVLFNLGGPDNLRAVQPFLFNLFNDPAIIGIPNPLRWILAKLISFRRAPTAKAIYAHLGGSSPLLKQTIDQAQALEKLFDKEDQVKTFIAMRYWHPLSDETARLVKKFGADRIVLLPLYPQYSTTTTGSSITEWRRAARKAGIITPTAAICCYPQEAGFIETVVNDTRNAFVKATNNGNPRVLFSAHGLPQKIVDTGDPYPDHIEMTAAEVVKNLNIKKLDWVVCYQSRVGPLKWIGPSTDDEIARAAKDGVPIVVVPIAFVSEHSETLVELDIEYRELAISSGVPAYYRVATAYVTPRFISGLKRLVKKALMVIKDADNSEIFYIFSGAGCKVCSSAGSQCRNNEK
jgi:protoporphyrin/coproporphyrin ferrochelatase